MQNFPRLENSNPAEFPQASTLEDSYQYDIDDQEYTDDKNTLTTLPDDVPYLHRFIHNLRYHQPIDAKVPKKHQSNKSLQINKKKATLTIMDEVKNMLDYKGGHYIKYEDMPQHTRKVYSAHLCLSNRNPFLMDSWIIN